MRLRRHTQMLKSHSRCLCFTILPLALCLTSALAPSSLAQKPEKSARKIIVTTKPDYPEILKRAQMGGLVRLKVTVLPDGTVTDVETLGGNPILAENAATAVKKWKFAPAPNQTVEIVPVRFVPD
jgi:TonB family protein